MNHRNQTVCYDTAGEHGNREGGKYADIMTLPRHVSAKYPRMPLSDRAAQFSPFAALTGHEEAILETARITDDFVELDDDRKIQINEQLGLIKEHLFQKPEIEVTYFQPDGKKSGGAYVAVRGRVKKIDECSRRILFLDGTALPMDYIFSIKGELFQNTDD